jgi:hypothetical protein
MKLFSRTSVLGLGLALVLAACDSATNVQAPEAPDVSAATLVDNAGDGTASFEDLELCKVWSDASTIATDFDVEVVDPDTGTSSGTRTLTSASSSECRDVARFDGTNNNDADGPATSIEITETSPTGTELVSITAQAIGRNGGAAGTIMVDAGTPSASGYGMSLDFATQTFSTGTVDNTQGFLVTFTNMVTPTGGGEGCTPGYWKQPQHFDSWVGYAPGDDFDSVFDPDDVGLRRPETGSTADITLLEALGLRGGGVNALIRHTVAALLNASNTGVSYDLTVADVLAKYTAAIGGDVEGQKDEFVGFNEQGCPLN